MKSRKHTLPCLLACAGLALSSCSDDGGNNQVQPDKFVTHKDGGDGHLADTTPGKPDVYVPPGCVKECVEQAVYLCVKDSTGTCQECLQSSHCKNNPWSFGPTCDTTNKICECATKGDCATNKWGKICDSTYYFCSCKVDADCQTGFKCISSISTGFSTVSVCAVPCKSSADCTSSSAPICNTTSGKCVQCLKQADCAGNQNGSYCDATKNTCTCTGDNHCKGTYAWGNKCDTTTYKRCTCSSNAECTGNPNGPTCNTTYKKCTCASNADCKTAPYTKCALPYSSALYMHCQKACTKDADCTDSTMPKCNTTTGKCAACKSNADCTSSAPICNTGKGICEVCITNVDCKGGYKWGNKCMPQYSGGTTKGCWCESSADCAGNANGPTCFTTYSKCTCKTDTECKVSPYTKCNLPYSSGTYMHCQKACTKDADCTESTLSKCNPGTGKCVQCKSNADCTSSTAKICNTATGLCIQCKIDADCTSSTYKYCLPSTGKCVQCKSNADCTSSSYPYCDTSTGSCSECSVDADCKSGYKWGNKCTSSSSGKRCRCAANSDCTGNPNGPTCYTSYGYCTCGSDTECKTSPYLKCLVPYSGASYKHCRKVCTSNADCAAETWNWTCDTSSGDCEECLVSADCTTKSLGNQCDATYYYCYCKSDPDCTTNLNGKLCDTSVEACSCKLDTDCPTGRKCTGTFLTAKICQ